MGQHFDWRYELNSIWQGMDRDLYQPVGQNVPWYVFDSANTGVDPIYDVADMNYQGGRRFKTPIRVPVMNAVKVEGGEIANDRGLYTIDTIRLTVSVDALRRSGLGDVIFRPEAHVVDRLVYENKLFAISEIRVRGILTADYAVVGVDAQQMKNEEFVNDPMFSYFASRDDA